MNSQTMFSLAVASLKAFDVAITSDTFDTVSNTGFVYYPDNCSNIPDYEITRRLRQAVDDAFAGISISSKVFMPSHYTVRAHLDFAEGTLTFNFDVPRENVKIVFVSE